MHHLVHERAEVGEVLEEGVGVAVALDDDGLGLVGVEVVVVLEGAGVSGADGGGAGGGEALEVVELAGVDAEAGGAEEFGHEEGNEMLVEHKARHECLLTTRCDTAYLRHHKNNQSFHEDNIH